MTTPPEMVGFVNNLGRAACGAPLLFVLHKVLQAAAANNKLCSNTACRRNCVNGVPHLGPCPDRIRYGRSHTKIKHERTGCGSKVSLVMPMSREHGGNVKRHQCIDLLSAVLM